jgi:hypothetical protein
MVLPAEHQRKLVFTSSEELGIIIVMENMIEHTTLKPTKCILIILDILHYNICRLIQYVSITPGIIIMVIILANVYSNFIYPNNFGVQIFNKILNISVANLRFLMWTNHKKREK